MISYVTDVVLPLPKKRKKTKPLAELKTEAMQSWE